MRAGASKKKNPDLEEENGRSPLQRCCESSDASLGDVLGECSEPGAEPGPLLHGSSGRGAYDTALPGSRVQRWGQSPEDLWGSVPGVSVSLLLASCFFLAFDPPAPTVISLSLPGLSLNNIPCTHTVVL